MDMGNRKFSRINARALTGRGADKLAARSPVPPEHAHVQRSSAPSFLKAGKNEGSHAKTMLPMSESRILAIAPLVSNIMLKRMRQ